MTSSNFHNRAISWLRDHDGLEPNNPSATVPPDPNDPSRAQVDGTCVPAGTAAPAFGVVLALFAVAGVAAMLAGRGGLSPSIAAGANVIAAVTAAVAILVWVLDARRARRSRRPVRVVVLARTGGNQSGLEVREVERLASATTSALWLVSEAGFQPDAQACLRELGGRAFTVRDGRIVDLDPPAAALGIERRHLDRAVDGVQAAIDHVAQGDGLEPAAPVGVDVGPGVGALERVRDAAGVSPVL